MTECLNCGHPLKSAQKFCIVCGTPAGKGDGGLLEQMNGGGGRKGLPQSQNEELDGITCAKCQSPADHYCYFCEDAFCRAHLRRLQPNRMHLDQMRLAIQTGNFNEVNRGWMGSLVYACSRCYSMNYERELEYGQKEEMACFERCNWYDPDVGSRSRRPGY